MMRGVQREREGHRPNPVAIAQLILLALLLLSPHGVWALSFAGQPYVQYGDAQSYALAVDQLLTGCSTPGCTYYIPSSPGQISDLVVIATGASGNPVNTNFAGMDNAYSTPSGVSGSPYFQTGGVTVSPDPGGAGQFSGDSGSTWDTTLGALKTFLAGDSLVFFFNNNQVNSGDPLSSDQSLAAWARITIKDGSGNIIGTYDFTNNNSAYAGIFDGGGGVPNGDVTTYSATNPQPRGDASGSPTDYVLSGGPLCLNSGVPVSCSAPHDQVINNNLGANEAAYALLFPELNSQLAGLFASLSDAELALYSMNLDIRLGCDPSLFTTSAACVSKSLNNGYEQIFFGPLESLVIPTPEPASLLLFGFGLLGLAAWKKHQSA